MNNKKSWYETIQDRLPEKNHKFDLEKPFSFPTWSKLHDILLNDDSIIPFNDIMEDFDKFGFEDKGDYYEMTTNLGGQKNEGDTPENRTKIELTGRNNRTVKITYEYSNKDSDGNNFYSHSQMTQVVLPDNADEDTLHAFYNDDNNIVLTVKKKVKKEPEKKTRSIPIEKKGK